MVLLGVCALGALVARLSEREERHFGLLLLQDGPLQVDSVGAPALSGLRLDLGVDHCTSLRRCQHGSVRLIRREASKTVALVREGAWRSAAQRRGHTGVRQRRTSFTSSKESLKPWLHGSELLCRLLVTMHPFQCFYCCHRTFLPCSSHFLDLTRTELTDYA